MTPDQSRAAAAWLNQMPAARASGIRARFLDAPDPWAVLTASEQGEAIRALRDLRARQARTRP